MATSLSKWNKTMRFPNFGSFVCYFHCVDVNPVFLVHDGQVPIHVVFLVSGGQDLTGLYGKADASTYLLPSSNKRRKLCSCYNCQETSSHAISRPQTKLIEHRLTFGTLASKCHIAGRRREISLKLS